MIDCGRLFIGSASYCTIAQKDTIAHSYRFRGPFAEDPRRNAPQEESAGSAAAGATDFSRADLGFISYHV